MHGQRNTSLIKQIEALPLLEEWVGLQFQKVGDLACLHSLVDPNRFVGYIHHKVAAQRLHEHHFLGHEAIVHTAGILGLVVSLFYLSTVRSLELKGMFLVLLQGSPVRVSTFDWKGIVPDQVTPSLQVCR